VRRVTAAAILLLAWAVFPVFAQYSFQAPLMIRSGSDPKVLRLGASSRNTIGLDRDTLLRIFFESAAPPAPLPPVPMDVRFVTIPGRDPAYGIGLAGGVLRDFRNARDTAQVDSFLVQIQGDSLLTSPTEISWPSNLARFARAWHIVSWGSGVVPETDMLTSGSVTIPANPLAGVYKLLVVKTGLRPTLFPAASVDQVMTGPGFYRFDQGSNGFDRDSNQTGVCINIVSIAGAGVLSVERYDGKPANIQFAGSPPKHIGAGRWVMRQMGISSLSAGVIFEHTLFASGVKNSGSIIVYQRRTEGEGAFSPLLQDSLLDPLLVRVSVTGLGEFIFGAEDDQLTGVARGPSGPTAFQLEQSYPNPFNPATSIRYTLASGERITLKVYDLLGREVASLVDGFQAAGSHVVIFSGERLPSGVYFYRLQSQTLNATKKMLLLK